MFYYQSSLWEDLFFPQRNNNLKKVVFLSAITGVASAAITNYFSKKENRVQTRRNFDRLFDEIRALKDRAGDKAHHLADEFNDSVKRRARRMGDNIPDVDDNSNSE